MIRLDDISLQRGSKFLLQSTGATFYPGQKIALIGANGSGKSSLFQLLLGQLQCDQGSLHIPNDWRIAHMAQEVAVSERRAIDYVLDGDQRLRQLQAQLAEAESESESGQSDGASNLADEDAWALKIAALHEQLDNIDGYNAAVRAEQLLQGLGFAHTDAVRPANSFSGGWRIRLNLAQALMSPSDLLLLDEPTNHLDLDAELWLEQWLQRYRGSLLLISHDRDFIDSVCAGIVHIEHQKLTSYSGNYSAFERQRAERLAQQQASYEKQQVRKKEIHSFVSRFRAKATKAKQAQSRLKELERMEDIAPAHIDSPFDFSIPVAEKISDPLLNISQANLGYSDTIILKHVNLSIHPGSRIGFLGANGAGKSTLLKTLAKEVAPLSGTLTQGENCALGYFSQHQLEALDLNASPALHIQRLSPTAREQDIRNFLGGFDFHGDMAMACIDTFSGGEKARLALAMIVWQKPNVLLLDEPTNHLDLEMCHALTVALQSFAGAVVVVSHDRHLLRNSVDQFYLVANHSVVAFDGDLEDYASWLMQQKRQANHALTDDDSEHNEARNPSDADHSAHSKKEQRQQAAELRKKLNPLNNAIKKAEQQLAKAEATLASLEEQLTDSAMYEAANKSQLQTLLQQQAALQKDKNHFEEQWLTLQEELEALQG